MLSRLLRCLLVFILGLIGVAGARAQGTAEYGSTAAKTGATAAAAKPPKPSVEAPAPAPPGHLPIQDSEKVAADNRRALEELAGSDAGKVSLGSTPVGAQAWMDGKFVGTAPVELTLAPGLHRVEMRSPGREWARQDVRVLPKRAQQVVLSLKPRYSRNITLR